MPIVGQFGSLAGLGSLILPGGAMESIATVTVGSGGASSIEFTSIPGTYQHLQIRMIGRTTTGTAGGDEARIQFNGNTGSNYTTHGIYGMNTTVYLNAKTSQTSSYWIAARNGNTASVFAGAIVDILDYANTSKNTTIRTFTGFDTNDANGNAGLYSGLWMVTDAITSIKLLPESNNWAQHTTAALYGLRAP